MADLPSPSATRLARPRWLDARLLTGVLLVLLSVTVGAKVVAEADDTVPVWAASRDLAPHAVLTEDDVERVDVRLGTAAGQYVSALGEPPIGHVVTRELRRSELLPAAAVLRENEAAYRRVVVEVESETTAGLHRHSVVDVYVVPDPRSDEGTGEAQKVLDGVSVDDDPNDGGGIRAGSATTGVVLLVPEGDVAALLTAQSRGTTSLVQRQHSPAVPEGNPDEEATDEEETQP